MNRNALRLLALAYRAREEARSVSVERKKSLRIACASVPLVDNTLLVPIPIKSLYVAPTKRERNKLKRKRKRK